MYKLKDICSLITDKILINELINTNLYVSTENMLPNKCGIVPPTSIPIDCKVVAYKKDDVLVSNIRPYFKKIWFALNDGGCSNDVLVFRAKHGISPIYLHYILANDAFFDYAMKTSKGTKMPRGDKKSIMEYEVFEMDYKKQEQTSIILHLIDKKIALNTAINDNLEQQAQAIFKAWFVDFLPFGGVMPDDWRMGKLKEILSLKKNSIKAGTDIELPYLPIEKIPMNTFAVKEFCPNSEAKSSLITFNENDIIIGAMRVYFHRVIIAPCSGITRTTCFVLVPYDKNYLAYSLLLCNQNKSIDFAQRTSKGSTMPYAIWEGGLGDMDIIIPNYETITKFNNIIVPMLEKIKYSYFENQRLSALRDTLLPKLMNGEIDVSAVRI